MLPSLGTDEWIGTGAENYYGTHLYTCYDCLKHYCYYCGIGDDHVGKRLTILHECDMCRRDYCKGCSEMTFCSGWAQNICNHCYKYEWSNAVKLLLGVRGRQTYRQM